MSLDKFSAIKNVIDTIEQGIKTSIDLDDLSRKVGISKYHLHRLFKSITGKPLMTYVRDRKLSSSVARLLDTNLKIIDIATEYDFDYEQSYIRAFKQKFNISPAQFRKSKREIDIEQKIDVNSLSALEQGIIISPRMCIKPKFHLQGIRSEIFLQENILHATAKQQAVEFQNTYIPLIKHTVNKDVYFGLVFYSNDESISNTYISCIEVSEIDTPVPPISSYTISMQEYAVFRYIGFHSPYDISFVTLRKLYSHIYKWKYESAYCQPQNFHFERMDMNVCSDTYCEMDIYTPISSDV